VVRYIWQPGEDVPVPVIWKKFRLILYFGGWFFGFEMRHLILDWKKINCAIFDDWIGTI